MRENEPGINEQAPLGEDYISGRYIRLLTMMGVISAGLLPELISKGGEAAGVIERDVLPEPWDVPDHIGNFFEGGNYTVAAFSVCIYLATRRSFENYHQKLRTAAVGAFVASSAVQILGEKYVRLGGLNTGDMIDASYGVTFSALAAVLCVAGFQKAYDADMKAVDYYRKNAGDDSLLFDEDKPDTRPAVRYTKKPTPTNRKNVRKQQKASRKKNR